jgi:hypothetical protein
MKKQRFLLLAIVALSMIVILLFGCAAPATLNEQLKATSSKIQKAVQQELDNMDRDVQAAAAKLSSTGLNGNETRTVLNELSKKYPYIIDICTTDTDGIMLTIAPQAYSKYEGTDISGQDVTREFNNDRKPMLSKVFTSVEGMDAVVLTVPISLQKGDFIGSLSAMFQPEALFKATAESLLEGTGMVLNVIQTDGLNIYDSEYADTGQNLFTDPEFQPYTELVELGHKIAAQESGTGSYTFVSHAANQVVKKQAYWATAGLHGTEWRLIVTKEVAE